MRFIQSRFGALPLGMMMMWTLPAQAQTEVAASETASEDANEIIVTARRKAESLQDVPVSVTALSQDELTRENIQSLGDLQHSVPSLTLFGASRNSAAISIRGQGGFTPSGIPAVVLYLNDVPMATSAQAGSAGAAAGANGLFYDLENVQVLKGPQGTLFGRNTTGGAVLLQSRRPDYAFGGHVTGTLGNYDDREIDAAINLPLAEDRLALRVAVNTQDRDGFTFVQATPSDPDGVYQDDTHHRSARASLLFDVTPDLQNLTIADYYKSDNDGSSAVLVGINGNPAHPVNVRFPGAASLVAVQQRLGIRETVPISVDMYSKYKRWSVTNLTMLDVTDSLTVKNIASYSWSRYVTTLDRDGTIFPIFEPIFSQDIPYTTRQFTEELQLQGKAFSEKLDWTAGLFYLNLPAEDYFTRHTQKVLGGVRVIGFKQSEKSTAAFFQGDLELTPTLSFTGGVRYTWETIGRANRDVLGTGACTNAFADANCVLADKADFEAPTWTLGLNYKPADDVLVYLSSRRGARSGGFNFVAGAPAADQVYDQEFVTDVELGAKARWDLGGARLTTNGALYRQYYKDIQLSETFPIAGSLITVLRNAGKATIDGAEFEGRLEAGGLELGGHFAYIDYDFTEVNPGVAQPLVVTNIPTYKYGLSARYSSELPDGLGGISFSANWNWQDDSYIAAINNDPFAIQDAYGLLSIGATWRDVGGAPVDLSFFMTNVTKTDYAIGSLPLTVSVGMATQTFGAPRMLGVRLGYRFGSEQ